MSVAVKKLLIELKDPKKELALIRAGLKARLVEQFLVQEDFSIKDVLKRLHISASTYFAKKKSSSVMDVYTTEKFVRLITVMELASSLLGNVEAKSWLYRAIPSLGNEQPIDLLDTSAGHRLVVQALLQIQYGIYD